MRFNPFRRKTTRYDQLRARNDELRKQNHSLRDTNIARSKKIDELHARLQDEKRTADRYRKAYQDLQIKVIPTDNA